MHKLFLVSEGVNTKAFVDRFSTVLSSEDFQVEEVDDMSFLLPRCLPFWGRTKKRITPLESQKLIPTFRFEVVAVHSISDINFSGEDDKNIFVIVDSSCAQEILKFHELPQSMPTTWLVFVNNNANLYFDLISRLGHLGRMDIQYEPLSPGMEADFVNGMLVRHGLMEAGFLEW